MRGACNPRLQSCTRGMKPKKMIHHFLTEDHSAINVIAAYWNLLSPISIFKRRRQKTELWLAWAADYKFRWIYALAYCTARVVSEISRDVIWIKVWLPPKTNDNNLIRTTNSCINNNGIYKQYYYPYYLINKKQPYKILSGDSLVWTFQEMGNFEEHTREEVSQQSAHYSQPNVCLSCPRWP